MFYVPCKVSTSHVSKSHVIFNVIAREIHVTRYDFETFHNFYRRKA